MKNLEIPSEKFFDCSRLFVRSFQIISSSLSNVKSFYFWFVYISECFQFDSMNYRAKIAIVHCVQMYFGCNFCNLIVRLLYYSIYYSGGPFCHCGQFLINYLTVDIIDNAFQSVVYVILPFLFMEYIRNRPILWKLCL